MPRTETLLSIPGRDQRNQHAEEEDASKAAHDSENQLKG